MRKSLEKNALWLRPFQKIGNTKVTQNEKGRPEVTP
jgi:hypothetical protein